MGLVEQWPSFRVGTEEEVVEMSREGFAAGLEDRNGSLDYGLLVLGEAGRLRGRKPLAAWPHTEDAGGRRARTSERADDVGK
jgi:hypothetical protein